MSLFDAIAAKFTKCWSSITKNRSSSKKKVLDIVSIEIIRGTESFPHFDGKQQDTKVSIENLPLFDAIGTKFAGYRSIITKKALFDRMKTLIYTYTWFDGKVHACDFAFCANFRSKDGGTLLLLQNKTMTGTDTYSSQYFLLNPRASWVGARWHYDETKDSIYVQDYVCTNSWNGAGYYKERIYYELPDVCDIFVFDSAEISAMDLGNFTKTFSLS